LNPNLLKAIQRGDAIPSMPQIAVRLLEILSDDEYRHADVAQLLSSDPAIAGDILRFANSPLFGLVRKVRQLGHAITLLGMKRVRTLLISRCLVDGLEFRRGGPVDRGYFWRRSLISGALAAHFARLAAAAPGREEERDEAFIAGLLSDAGVAVLARALPAEYAPLGTQYAAEPAEKLVLREREQFGVAHPEVSALVLEKWMLPEEIVRAVRQHHDAGGTPAAAADPLVRAVAGAAVIAPLLCAEPGTSDPILPACRRGATLAGADVSLLPQILHAIEADTLDLAGMLRIEVVPQRAYAQVADALVQELATTTP